MDNEVNNVRTSKSRLNLSRLNVDIPDELFIRLNIYCAKEKVYKKDILPLIIEQFLDEMEGGKND